MGTQKMIKPLYIVAAIYDAVLGIAFLFAADAVFEQFMPEKCLITPATSSFPRHYCSCSP